MKFQKMTISQSKDTGLAIILILLLITHFIKLYFLIIPTIVMVILTMTLPKIIKPLAFFWFGLSNLIGKIVSNILLTIIFFTVITPVALIRRIYGADPMKLKLWKKGRSSVFSERKHLYSAKDIENPY